MLSLTAFAWAFSGTLAAKQETGFLDRTVTVGGETFKYQVYVPAQWSKKTAWPVILFLHGAGERGEDGVTPTDVGIGTAAAMTVSLPSMVKGAEFVMP